MPMIKIITLLMVISVSTLFSQEYYPFSEQEIIEITHTIQTLKTQDSLNVELINLYKSQLIDFQSLHRLDSLEVLYLNKQIELIQELNKQNEPKWYTKYEKYGYFILGFSTLYFSAQVVESVK